MSRCYTISFNFMKKDDLNYMTLKPSNSWAQSWVRTYRDMKYDEDHAIDTFRFLQECLPTIEKLYDEFIVNDKEDNNMYKPSDEYCMKQLGIKEVCDLRIKKVIFNKPATIILWEDGTKTVVKCQKGDKYDKQKGFAFALMKKIYGAGFNDVIKYWCE